MSSFENQSGKIGPELFSELLKERCGKASDRLVTGPKYGVDTAVIDIGNAIGLAISSDPLSLIPSLGLEESAWLSVHLLVNDMATTGFAPQFAQFVLNLPADIEHETFDKYWDHIHKLCKKTGVTITGGHTGRVPGQESTMPGGGTMFLTAPLKEIITSDRAEPGNKIIVTKESALAASSILAISFPETVKNGVGEEIHRQGCENFYRTSSLQDALEASSVLEHNTELKAMHDATEGGILGAIEEMARASGCGFMVYDDRLPIGEAQKQICSLFEIDPRISVGAGSMVMAVEESAAEKAVSHLISRSIPACIVGEITPAGEGCRIVTENGEEPFSFDSRDPYWQAFFRAMKEGLQ